MQTRHRGSMVAVFAACAMAASCSGHDGGNGTAAHDTAEHTARAAGHVGNALVEGVQSLGDGVLCGARELGQTLSGTQGEPHAEALSQAACSKAQQHATRAGQLINQAGQQIESAPAPSSTGGGPKAPPR